MWRNNGWGGRWQNGGWGRRSQGYGQKGGSPYGGYGGKGVSNPFGAIMRSVNEVRDFQDFLQETMTPGASSSNAAHNSPGGVSNGHGAGCMCPLCTGSNNNNNTRTSVNANSGPALDQAATQITDQLVERVTTNLAQRSNGQGGVLNGTMNRAFGAAPQQQGKK